MDTPIVQKPKGPRRKLKKIMKKNKGSFHASTHNIYQKKLKSAINVSLNSTRNISSLQANNRSLAASLERMTQDLRILHDTNTSYLEKNHELSEKILELKRLVNDPGSYIEEEVNRRFEVRTQELRRKLKSLNSHASGFLEVLMELTEMCSARTSSASDDQSSHGYSISPYPANRDDLNPETLRDPGLVVEGTEHYSEGKSNRFGGNDMSLIMEQSVLIPTADTEPAVACELEMVSESDTVQFDEFKKPLSKLPLRVPKLNREPAKQDSQKIMDTVTAINTELVAGAAQKSIRRETFILKPNSELQSESISDVELPQNIVSDHLEFGNKEADLDVDQEAPDHSYPEKPVSNSPPSLLQRRDNTKGKSQKIKGLNSLKAPSKLDQGPAKNKVTQKQSIKNLNTLKKGASAQSLEKSKEIELCISNEFELMNAHKQLMEKYDRLESQPEFVAMVYRTPHQTEELTIHTLADMDLTMAMGEGAVPDNTQNIGTTGSRSPLIDSINNKQGECIIQSRSRSRSKQKLVEHPLVDETESCDEKVPDAVTMRVSKPGQFVFAASRKELDGTRKNLPNVAPRARSKSKKQMAEMIENLPQEEPTSIFDFHDKTPKSLNSEKQTSLSVFSISADESALSPLLPLSKSRHRSRAASNQSEEKPAPPSPHINKTKETCLGEGLIYLQQLKGSPDSKGHKSKYRTRSQSRGRTQEKSEDLDKSPRARSDSGEKVTRQATVSPDDKGCSGRARSRGRTAKKSFPLPGVRKTRIKSSEADAEPQSSDVGSPPLDGSYHETKLPRTRSRGRSLRSDKDADQLSAKYKDVFGLDIGDAPSLMKNDANTITNSKEPRRRDLNAVSPKEGVLTAKSKSSSPSSRQAVKPDQSSFTGEPLASTKYSVGEERNSLPNHVRIVENFTDKYGRDMLERSSPPKKKSPLSKRVKNSKKKGACLLLEGSKEEVKNNEKESVEPREEQEPSANGLMETESNNSLPSSLTSSKDSHISSNEEAIVVSQGKSEVELQEQPDVVSQEETEESYLSCHSKIEEDQVETEVQKKSVAKAPGTKKTYPQKVMSDIDINQEVSHKKCSKKLRNKSQSKIHGDSDEIQAKFHERKTELSAKQLDSLDINDEGYGEPNEKKCRTKPRNPAISSPQAIKLASEQSPSTKVKKTDDGVKVVADEDNFEKESKELLNKVKLLKTPAMSKSEDNVTSNKTDPLEEQVETTGPRVSKIMKKSKLSYFCQDTSPKKPVNKQGSSEILASDSPAPEGKRRRAATNVSYAEVPLNKKMRRGDPFTSHYCSTDKLDIFKSPKSKARKKTDLRRDVLGPLHNMAIKEEEKA